MPDLLEARASKLTFPGSAWGRGRRMLTFQVVYVERSGFDV